VLFAITWFATTGKWFTNAVVFTLYVVKLACLWYVFAPEDELRIGTYRFYTENGPVRSVNGDVRGPLNRAQKMELSDEQLHEWRVREVAVSQGSFWRAYKIKERELKLVVGHALASVLTSAVVTLNKTDPRYVLEKLNMLAGVQGLVNSDRIL